MVLPLFWTIHVLTRLYSANKHEFPSRGHHIFLHLPLSSASSFLTPASFMQLGLNPGLLSRRFNQWHPIRYLSSVHVQTSQENLYFHLQNIQHVLSLRCPHSWPYLFSSLLKTNPKILWNMEWLIVMLQFTTRGQSFFCYVLMCLTVQVEYAMSQPW